MHHCLDEELTDYAGGRLSPVRRQHWDLHLVTCGGCRSSVDSERRLQSALRLDTVEMPSDLRTALLALATSPEGGLPTVPAAPGHVRRAVAAAPLATLAPTAPAAHRPMARPAFLAGLAASAGAAAAIGLSLGSAGSAATQIRPMNRPAQPAAVTAPSAVVAPAGWRAAWSFVGAPTARSTP